jgi:hypothetical protein
VTSRCLRIGAVIHDPITDYERYECEWGYVLNAQAGELIRIIDLADTSLPPALAAVEGDFWLIDGRDVVGMDYGLDGQFHGARVLEAEHLAPQRAAAEIAWQLGEDFAAWWDNHPRHHRAA